MEKSKIAPHVCPQCGSAAYLGAFDLECTGQKCDHYHAETAAAYKAERFRDSVDSIEDEDTQPDGFIRIMVDGKPTLPRSSGSFRWPAVAPAAVFPDTDSEMADEIKQAVVEAKADPRCSPDDAKALDDWLKEILRDYVTAYGEKWIGTRVEARPSATDPRRLDISIQLTKIVPVIAEPIEVIMDLGPAAKKIPLVSDIHFPDIRQKVTDYVDKIRRQQEADAMAYAMQYFAAVAQVPTDIAFGQNLDKWARIWGCDRRPGETDTDLRKRINGASMFSPGASL